MVYRQRRFAAKCLSRVANGLRVRLERFPSQKLDREVSIRELKCRHPLVV